MKTTDTTIVKKALAHRPDDAHKGTMGALLSICGCYGMAGACILSGTAALRCGIGLLKCALPASVYPLAAVKMPESVYLPLPETADGKLAAANAPLLSEQAADARLIGCGMGLNDDTRALTHALIRHSQLPTVLDADALNAVAGDPSVLREADAPVIITPHPAEMARLMHTTAHKVNENRLLAARSFAARYHVIVVLKGAGTVIAAPDGSALVNPTGNSGMATGGSGDVLAGMCASLVAQRRGENAFDCAAAAVYLHGLAGDLAAERLGKISMLPRDIIDEIPQAFAVVTNTLHKGNHHERI